MSAQQKITVTFFDNYFARTTGIPLQEAAKKLGIWSGKNETELHRYFVHWLDITKYRLSEVWQNKTKGWRLFEAGFSITEQLDTTIQKLAEETTGDVELEYVSITARTPFFRLVGKTMVEWDARLTFYSNLSSKWLPTNADSTYWTQFLTDAGFPQTIQPPILPSVQEKMFKTGFNADTVI